MKPYNLHHPDQKIYCSICEGRQLLKGVNHIREGVEQEMSSVFVMLSMDIVLTTPAIPALVIEIVRNGHQQKALVEDLTSLRRP